MNVYLPDELAAQAKAAGLNLSWVTQEAVGQALAIRSTDAWLETLHNARQNVEHDVALEALDAVREEPTTRHG